MLKIGIIGLGHLGKIHLEQWKSIPGTEIVGVYDINQDLARNRGKEFNVSYFDDADDLINSVDAIDIVSPTISHFYWAQKAALKGKHLFIEKPMTQNIKEAEELIKIVTTTGIKCQIGHVERYNPAILALKDMQISPLFIESHRLSPFNPRGTDVSVIMDLMIHDIDILLHLVKSPIQNIAANGVAVLSNSPDIANARITFENGCVANLTSSRISLKKMRKMRIFQKDAYIGIDFLKKESEIIQLKEGKHSSNPNDFQIDLTDGTSRTIAVKQAKVEYTNAIQQELADFTLAILANKKVSVDVYDGYHAVKTAYKVLREIENNLKEIHENESIEDTFK